MSDLRVHDALVYPTIQARFGMSSTNTALYVICSLQFPCPAVDEEFHAAQHLDVQTGRGDDDVGFEFPPGLQQDAVLGEGIDLVGDHRRLPDLSTLNRSPFGTAHNRSSQGM